MFFDSRYDETTWQNDSDAFERAQTRNEELQMQDVIFDRVAVARCDGSGIAEEYYFEADQTQTIPCPGCVNCALRESNDAEMVEFRGRRGMAKAEELDVILSASLCEFESELERARRRAA